MKRLIARGSGLVAVAASVAAVGVFSAGLAHADPYVGRTYSDASERISNSGRTPIVATVNGDSLALDDCIVESWNNSNFLDGTTGGGPDREVLLNLNCNYKYAQPGRPGNSVASPEGRAAKAKDDKDKETAQALNENPQWCFKTDSNLANCQKFCNRTGLCEFEL